MKTTPAHTEDFRVRRGGRHRLLAAALGGHASELPCSLQAALPPGEPGISTPGRKSAQTLMGAQEGSLFRGPRGWCRNPLGLCPVSKPRHPPVPGKILILEVAGLVVTVRESLHFPGDFDAEACGPYFER